MSIIARGTKSIKKQDVVEQKSIALGLKKIVFAHKANAGEAGINIASLVTPPEMSANGFVNPTINSIIRVNIFQNKNNLKIVSSLSGILIPFMSYTVNSSTYIAFNGFTAAQDEVFTVYLDEVPTTSLSVVDGAPIIASGTLLAGQTDFNIGTPIEINKNPAQQIGAVMVYVDRGLQYRKVGNSVSGDGDYIEVPVPGGLGSLIRFEASGVDRFVTVVSNGVVAERPSGSMTAMIENVQGQIDQIVPTVAALAGVPETNFQTAPNSVDLKQFGDTVIENNALLQLIKTASVPIVTDWQAYTPTFTGFGTSTGIDVYWRRVGSDIQVRGSFTPGTTTATEARISLPSGLTTTTDVVENTIIGTYGRTVSTTSHGGFIIKQNAVSYVKMSPADTFSGATNSAVSSANANAVSGGGGDRITFEFFTPILGWSSTQTIAEILGI